MNYKRFCAMTLAMSVGFTVLGTACSKSDDSAESTSPMEELSADKLIEAEEMPEELPEGVTWFNYIDHQNICDQVLTAEEDGIIGVATLGDSIYMLKVNYKFDEVYGDDVFKYTMYKMDSDWNIVSESEITVDGFNYIASLENADGKLYMRGFTEEGGYLYEYDESVTSIEPNKMLMRGNSAIEFAKMGDEVVGYTSSDNIVVMDSAGQTIKKMIDLSGLLRDDKLSGFGYLWKIGPRQIVIEGYTSANNTVSINRYYVVDVDSGEISSITESEYIPHDVTKFSYVNGNSIVINDSGIYRIDFENKTSELMLSFNCTNCNRYVLRHSNLIGMEDGSFSFIYKNDSMEIPYGQPDLMLFSLNASDSYDQSGKKVISVASTDPLNFEIAEAIFRYNEISSDTYAVFDDRYLIDLDIWEGDGLTPDEKAFATSEAYRKSYDLLMVDITAGDGPDLFVTQNLNLALSDDAYMMDVKDLITEDTDDGYFTNAFDAAMIDGGLYQVPVDFYVDGISASSDKLGGKTGMTFDEYDTFVSTVCNGTDPAYDHVLNFSRVKLATELFNKSSDLFIKDGKIDVNNEAFKAILDYCAKLPKQSMTVDFEDPEAYMKFLSDYNILPILWGSVHSYGEYGEYSEVKGYLSSCGYPSFDGRSAAAAAGYTCGITAHAEDVDSCVEFIDVLLSEDVQVLADNNRTPVCKEALRTHGKNKNIEISGFSGYYLDWSDALISKYEDYLSAASGCVISDEDINIIIYEEIPAYLEGQKSFEEVAEIINNRATTVLEERK